MFILRIGGGGGGGSAKKSRAKRKNKEKGVPMGEPIFEEPDEGAAADMPVPDSPLTARRKKKEKDKKESELDETEKARIEQESEEASVRHFVTYSCARTVNRVSLHRLDDRTEGGLDRNIIYLCR